MTRVLLAAPWATAGAVLLIGFLLQLGDRLARLWISAAGAIWVRHQDWWRARRTYRKNPASAPEWLRRRVMHGYWRAVWK